MRSFKPYIVAIAVSLMAVSCGVDGDPGHCYISIEWEYYNEDYGVYYYEDNNPDVPDSDELVSGYHYESYPGRYDYYYESEDTEYWYDYTGFYELFQNPGTAGGLLHDGLDGADTRFDLFLYVEATNSLDYDSSPKITPAAQPVATSPSEDISAKAVKNELSRSGRIVHGDPLRIETREREESKGNWTLRVEETVKVYKK